MEVGFASVSFVNGDFGFGVGEAIEIHDLGCHIEININSDTIGDILGHHGSCADHSAITHGNTGGDDRPVTYPDVVAYPGAPHEEVELICDKCGKAWAVEVRRLREVLEGKRVRKVDIADISRRAIELGSP